VDDGSVRHRLHPAKTRRWRGLINRHIAAVRGHHRSAKSPADWLDLRTKVDTELNSVKRSRNDGLPEAPLVE
jgi:hypothetical protein